MRSFTLVRPNPARMLSLWTGTWHLWKPLATTPSKGRGRQRRPSSGTKRLSRSTHPVRHGRLGWRSTKGPDDELDHVTSEIAIDSELGTGATKTRRRRPQTPLAAADQDGRNCGQTVLLAGSQPQAKTDVPARPFVRNCVHLDQ